MNKSKKSKTLEENGMDRARDIESYIEKRLNVQMEYYHNICIRLEKQYDCMNYIKIVSTTMIAIFTLAIDDFEIAKYIVAILAALSSGVSSILFLKKPEERKISYRITYEKLKTEQILYINKVGIYKDKTLKDCKEIFITNCETIMGNEHEKWLDLFNGDKYKVN